MSPERDGACRSGARRSRLLPAVACALLLAPGPGAGTEGDSHERPTPLEAEKPEKVGAEFRAVCESIRRGRDPYYGLAPIEELRAALERQLPDQRARAALRAQLGIELLRVGENEEAVHRLAEARAIADAEELDLPLRRDILRKLALAQLRLGEQVNCVGHHNPDSCILPLTANAVHPEPAAALAALESYRAYVQLGSPQPAAVWLMNVAAMASGGYPSAVPEPFRLPPARLQPSGRFPRFPNVAQEVGLDIHQPSGGALMEDFDGDGRLDIVSSTIDPCGPMNFFHNTGKGRFENRTSHSGLDRQLGGLNLVHADYDNDGDADILVLRGGWMQSAGRMRNSLLRNRGDGTFDDVTRAAGLADPAYPTQTAAWFDYDLDGDLDLYIGNEIDDEIRPFPAQLFRNNGDGTFSDVAGAAGVTNDRMAKAVAAGDYDNDGDPDLYVSNMGPNRLYRNNGDGTFTDVAEEIGVDAPRGRSFPAWFFDYDNDGWLDLFVADYGAPLYQVAAFLFGMPTRDNHPLLYHNLGGARFEEVSRTAGLDVPCLPMGSNYGDLDNDGFLDLYLGTGTPSFESLAPNLMFRNDGGQRFENVTYAGGFGHLQKGHGVAFGDLDGDGDQDIFQQMGGAYPGDAYPSALYRNPGFGRSWVTLELVGRISNRSAIGTRLRLVIAEGERTREIHAVVGSGGSFGGSSLRQEIGLGAAGVIKRLDVTWPASKMKQSFEDVAINRVYRIREDEKQLRPEALDDGR